MLRVLVCGGVFSLQDTKRHTMVAHAAFDDCSKRETLIHLVRRSGVQSAMQWWHTLLLTIVANAKL